MHTWHAHIAHIRVAKSSAGRHQVTSPNDPNGRDPTLMKRIGSKMGGITMALKTYILIENVGNHFFQKNITFENAQR